MTTGTETVTTDNGGMTASETAYFETGGATDPNATADAGAEAGDGQADQTQNADGEGGKRLGPSGKTVALEALSEERGKRKTAEQRARDLEIQVARFTERFNVLAEFNKGSQSDKASPPDPETDFVAAIKHQGETLAQMQARLDKTDAQSKEAGEQQTLVRNYAAGVNQFEQTTPDFRAAYSHLLNSRAEELTDLGYSPEVIQAQLQQEELSIAAIAMQNNKNPGEVIYSLAKRRGYQKKADGSATAEKLDTIERGQSVNKSLNGNGGSSGDLEMTAERLVSMPNDQFLAWIEKNPDKARRLGVA